MGEKKALTLLDILRQLPKTNCKKCGIKTCMAFADAVSKGSCSLDACPFLSEELVARLGGNIAERDSIEREQEKHIQTLRTKIIKAGLPAAAKRLGSTLVDGRLQIACLGKNFQVDACGSVISECHTSVPWLTIPLLGFVVAGGGSPAAGAWVTFGELPGGGRWARLFGQRCENEFKELADGYPGLFGDITAIFSGSVPAGDIPADISLVLNPLPGLPVMICYWRPEGDFESRLKIYFDRTAEENLGIEYIYTLCVGMVNMFGKIAWRHNRA